MEGPGLQECKYEKCRYVHDLVKFMESKGEDLGSECPVFKSKGHCERGLTCRFAKSHMDGEGRNIKAENYNEKDAALKTTVNGIDSGE